MCLNVGTPETINFPFGTNGKLMVLGVPVLYGSWIARINVQTDSED